MTKFANAGVAKVLIALSLQSGVVHYCVRRYWTPNEESEDTAERRMVVRIVVSA